VGEKLLKGFSIFNRHETLYIHWRYRDYYGLFITIIASVAAMLVIVPFSALMIIGLFSTYSISVILFCFVMLAIFLYMLNVIISVLMNDTSITFDTAELRIIEGPFPWTRTQIMPTSDIECFEKQRMTLGQPSQWYYSVVVRLKNEREVDVVDELHWENEADYLLGIFTKRFAGFRA
jgi:hypothetical protein